MGSPPLYFLTGFLLTIFRSRERFMAPSLDPEEKPVVATTAKVVTADEHDPAWRPDTVTPLASARHFSSSAVWGFSAGLGAKASDRSGLCRL